MIKKKMVHGYPRETFLPDNGDKKGRELMSKNGSGDIGT